MISSLKYKCPPRTKYWIKIKVGSISASGWNGGGGSNCHGRALRQYYSFIFIYLFFLFDLFIIYFLLIDSFFSLFYFILFIYLFIYILP